MQFKDKSNKNDSSEESDELEEESEAEDSDSDWEPEKITKLPKIKKENKNLLEKELEAGGSDLNIKPIKITKQPKKENENKCLTPLNEFQMARQKNIADKMAFLKSLKIDEITDEIKEIVGSRKRKMEKKHYSLERKSKRLENFSMDFSENALQRKCFEEAEEINKSIMSFLQLPNLYKFEEAVCDGKLDLLKTYEKDFTELEVEKNNIPSFQHHIDRLDPSPTTKCAISSIPTCVDFHPAINKTLLLGGCSSGQIVIWNTDSDPLTFAPHTDLVTHVKVNPENPYRIISCSRDGTMRCADLQSKQFENIFEDRVSLSYFDFISPSVILVALTDGCVARVDSRIKRTKFDLWQCHQKALRTINVHPTNEFHYLTLDDKGSMKVWDTRSVNKLVYRPISSGLSNDKVFSAFFSPVTGKSILCSSRKSISIYDNSGSGSKFHLSQSFDVQHTSEDSLEIQKKKRQVFLKSKGKKPSKVSLYNVDGKSYTKASWLSNSDELFIVGNNFLKKLSVFNILGKEITHFNYQAITNFIPVHPIHNIFALTNGERLKIFSKLL